MENWKKNTIAATVTLLTFGVLLGVVAIAESMAADGRIDFCWVEQSRAETWPTWIVYGHRQFRQDVIVTRTRTFEEAVSAQNTCKAQP